MKIDGLRSSNETIIESWYVYLCWLLIDGALSSMTNSSKIFKQRFELIFQICVIEFKASFGFGLIFYLPRKSKTIEQFVYFF